MKQQTQAALFQDLEARTKAILLQVQRLRQLDPEALMQQPAPGKWSIAQVLEHLVSYGRYYLPLISQKLDAAPDRPAEIFRSGWLGDYFTKSMLPKNGVVSNPMKSPRPHAASQSPDSHQVISEFIRQQQTLVHLLDEASGKDLNQLRIPISLTRLIRLKLGDVFNFLIAHQERHFVQIRNVLSVVDRSERVS